MVFYRYFDSFFIASKIDICFQLYASICPEYFIFHFHLLLSKWIIHFDLLTQKSHAAGLPNKWQRNKTASYGGRVANGLVTWLLRFGRKGTNREEDRIVRNGQSKVHSIILFFIYLLFDDIKLIKCYAFYSLNEKLTFQDGV